MTIQGIVETEEKSQKGRDLITSMNSFVLPKDINSMERVEKTYKILEICSKRRKVQYFLDKLFPKRKFVQIPAS